MANPSAPDIQEPIRPEALPVSASSIAAHIYKVFPNDLNPHGTMFGGRIMSIIDRLALVVAERHSGQVCVTAGVDAMQFVAPAQHADTLIFSLSINRVWNSSMEIGAKVVAENRYNAQTRHIVSAYLTFIALDENNRPVKVPRLTLENAAQKARHEEAQIRRKARLDSAAAIQKSRGTQA